MKKRTKKHGNRLDDDSDQHLYVIYDHKERTIFKFGISKAPIGDDNQCSRMKDQVTEGNRWADMLRYSARILIRIILGRRKARSAEDDFIKRYQDKNGHLPRGNPDHRFLSNDEK